MTWERPAVALEFEGRGVGRSAPGAGHHLPTQHPWGVTVEKGSYPEVSGGLVTALERPQLARIVPIVISCFSKLFSAEQNHTYDLGELGRYHKRDQRLMDHWRGVLPAGRILDVRYEEVVADREKERGGSSPIAACPGTSAASPSARPAGRSAPRARRRCAVRSTTAPSAAGASTSNRSARS